MTERRVANTKMKQMAHGARQAAGAETPEKQVKKKGEATG
jgi:hypothetical protein